MVHTYTYTPDTTYWKQTLGFMQRWERAIPGPGSGHFHNHYGYTLIDHGLYTEAEREFRAYIRVSPNEANPYDSLAELFLLTGRPEEAIASTTTRRFGSTRCSGTHTSDGPTRTRCVGDTTTRSRRCRSCRSWVRVRACRRRRFI